MIRGVIFDVDGVLLDSMKIWENLGEEYLRIQGKEGRPGLREILFPMSLEQAADYLIKEYALEKTADQVVKEINGMIQSFYKETVSMKKGVRSYLSKFHQEKIPMAIASSGGKDNITAALDRLGVLGQFCCILTCSEVGSGKDHPQIYLKAAEMMGSIPEETLVFEDALHALLTAKHAGFCTAGVYDQSNWKDVEKLRKESDYFLEQYDDISSFWELVFGSEK